MCQTHRKQHHEGRVHLEPISRELKGTLRDGYVDVFVNGCAMPEHRYVMEQMLGRPLLKHEKVHHRNGIRHDNRPENLELWVRPQPQGQRISDLIEFIVKHYRDDVVAALEKEA